MQRTVWVIVFLLTACAPRGDFTLATGGPGAATPEAIFVGTTRAEDGDGFGRERALEPSFIRYDIAIPPEREVGELNWPPKTRQPDANRDFLTLAETRFAGPDDFGDELRAAMRMRKQTDAVIYVHGFNNTMAEGVYRVAQMHHDLKVPGVAVHYAWPSRGSALGYVYDRDSVLFARSGLVDLLDEVRRAGAKQIVIVAHSMGGMLTMEALREVVLR